MSMVELKQFCYCLIIIDLKDFLSLKSLDIQRYFILSVRGLRESDISFDKNKSNVSKIYICKSKPQEILHFLFHICIGCNI